MTASTPSPLLAIRSLRAAYGKIEALMQTCTGYLDRRLATGRKTSAA